MHQPRLHSSQELALHQINVDQSYHSHGGDGLTFPSSPVTFPQGGAGGTGQGGVGGPGERATIIPSPSFGGSTPIGQTPGGSSSTATAAIGRPEVRHRAEWASTLEDIEPFGMPGGRFLLSKGDNASVPVRYVADDYDRLWLAQRLDQYGADLSGHAGHWGKTGMLGATPPLLHGSRGSSSPVSSDIGVSVLEEIITAFELAAFYNPEIPLGRLSNVDGLYLEDVTASSAIVSDVRQYWLRKREALGGNMPCIPALKSQVREDNQTTLCHPEILGDCPLPFKWRDWTVSVVNRKRGRCANTGGGNECETKHSADAIHRRPIAPKAEDDGENLRFARVALAVSAGILHRERVRQDHTHLALYELACLRGVDDTTFTGTLSGVQQCLDLPPGENGPFTPATEAVPSGVHPVLIDLATASLNR